MALDGVPLFTCVSRFRESLLKLMAVFTGENNFDPFLYVPLSCGDVESITVEFGSMF